MKKLIGVLFAALVLYIIYYDLSVGTLPSASTAQPVAQEIDRSALTSEKPKTVIPSFDAKVKPGETVVSVVEHRLGKSLPVSINDLIEDFQQLNPGKSAENIKIGSTYRFPDYSK